MFNLTITKNKIINYDRDYYINLFIINNIFWYDNIFRILKYKNFKRSNFFILFYKNKKYQSEIIASLFYLQLKMINQNLFISFDFNNLFLKIDEPNIKIYIDPNIKIINIFDKEKELLLKIYNLKKINKNILIECNRIIYYNTLFLLELKESLIKKKNINNYIRIFCYDNLVY